MTLKPNFIFVDINPSVSNAYAKFFGREDNCKVRVGDIFNQGPGDIISPSNCIGNMDGGIEKIFSDRFSGLENRVNSFLRENYGGFLPIGKAQIIPTEDNKYPNLILTPTVITPGEPSKPKFIFESSNAAFQEIKKYNNKIKNEPESKTIQTVLIPGLGTLYGNLDPLLSAREVYKAYKLNF